METSRVEAFSDGVFAVAITLLVLDLRDPGGSGDLAHRLLSLWPEYVAYATSFLVIGIIWINHHEALRRIALVDRGLLYINLLVLLTVVAIPFPTAVLADSLRTSRDTAAACALYGAVLGVMGLSFCGLWVYLGRRPRLLRPGYSTAHVRERLRRSALGPPVYLTAGTLGLVSSWLSLSLFVAVTLFFAWGRASAPPAADEPPGV